MLIDIELRCNRPVLTRPLSSGADNMKCHYIVAVVMLSLPCGIAAQATAHTQTSAVKASPMVAITPAQRQAFEAGLAATLPGQPAQLTAHLGWKPLAGAASYRVLRYQQLGMTPAVVASNITAPQYDARVLPGYSFIFRVVAQDTHGIGVDTTGEARVDP